VYFQVQSTVQVKQISLFHHGRLHVRLIGPVADRHGTMFLQMDEKPSKHPLEQRFRWLV
jgi:hypothetical protein